LKNILIVGGAGYVGGAVVDSFSNFDPLSYHVRVYDALLYEESFRKPVDFVYGDIRDHKKLLPYLKWADTVIWLAALVGDGACELHPEISQEINTNSVKWLTENFDGQIVFTSTCSVYGYQTGELTEESPVNPLSVYAATKLEAEKYLKDALVFRLGTLFGVGDNYSRIRLDLVVNTLTVKAFIDRELHIYGGTQMRPLLHVKDVANTIKLSLDKNKTGIYNLCRQNVRITDLAYQIRNHFPDVEIITKDVPMQDTRSYQVSASKARQELQLTAIYNIDYGIDQLKELLEERRIKDINNPRYTNQAFLSKFNTHLEY